MIRDAKAGGYFNTHPKMKKLVEATRKYAAELQNRMDENEKSHAYVDVMPHTNPVKNKSHLTPDQAYALQTKGYVRDNEQGKPEMKFSPPPAKQNSDRVPTFYTAGADPLRGVRADRLNSTQRFDDYIKNQAMDGQYALNDTLSKAYQNIYKDADKQQQQKRDASNDRVVQSWIDATGWTPGTTGGGCSNC